MSKLPLRWKITVTICGTLLFLGAMLSVMTASISLYRMTVPTAAYIQMYYNGKEVCTGDMISVSLQFVTYNTAPALLERFDTWWDVGNQMTAVAEDTPEYTILETGGTFSNTLSVRVPMALDTGIYEYRRAVVNDGTPVVVGGVVVPVKRCSH